MWTNKFAEFFSTSVTQKGETRIYTASDVSVLAVIRDLSDHDTMSLDEISSEIRTALNSGVQYEDNYLELAYLVTPLFQEVPPGIDDSWTHGALIGGMTSGDGLAIAQSYRYAGDILIEYALKDDAASYLILPILYSYRHALEIYLKLCTENNTKTHNLNSLIASFQRQVQPRQISPWVMGILDDFHNSDANSTTFRYGENWPESELWIDLNQLKSVMAILYQELEHFIGDNVIRSRK